MARPVGVHPEAILEAQGAYRWYRDRNEATAEAFLAELDRAVHLVSDNPGSGRFTFTAQDTFCCVDFRLLSFIVKLARSFRSWRSRIAAEGRVIGRAAETFQSNPLQVDARPPALHA